MSTIIRRNNYEGICIEKYGGPEVLEEFDLPIPKVGGHDVF
ncbi:MAG TPA: hypothetical protein VN726_02470 [Hanamia sp.]|nr:hypothetical protein [Hanamia sp.]